MMKLLVLLLWCVAQVRAQTVSFPSTTPTFCHLPNFCPIRILISNDGAGAVASSMKLNFTGAGVTVIATLSGVPLQDLTMNFQPFSLLSSVAAAGSNTVLFVTPGATTALANGNYSISVSYVRTANAAVVTSTIPLLWTLWWQTPPPILLSPLPGAVVGNPFTLAYFFTPNPYNATTPLAGSVSLRFNSTTTLALPDVSDASSSISANVSDGNYNLTLSYRDNFPHAFASVTIVIRIDTISEPLIILNATSTYVSYRANEAGTVNVSWAMGWEVVTVYPLVPNYYFTTESPLTLAFVDVLSNPPATATVELPLVTAVNATTTTTIVTVTQTQIETENLGWLWLGLVIGLGSALLVALFAILGLYKGWCGPYARIKT